MAGYISWGTTFGCNDSGSQVVFPEVTSLSAPLGDTSLVETSHLTSASKRRTYASGMVDGSEISAEYNWTGVRGARVEALRGTEYTYRIDETDGSYISFSGLLMKHEVDYGQNDSVKKGKMSVKITGPVTLHSGSASMAAWMTPPEFVLPEDAPPGMTYAQHMGRE